MPNDFDRNTSIARKSLLFRLGHIVATPSALRTLTKALIDPAEMLLRHVRGDWAEMCPEDAAINRRAVAEGYRIFSAYSVQTTKVWVITEADRSSTCILLPHEY